MHPTLRVTRLVVPALLPLALGCGSSTNGTTPNQADAAMEASGHPTPPHHDAGAVRDTGASRDAASHDAGAADAPADVDNGAPSSIYPAPHPPLPLLTNLQGGPVLTTPKVYLVYYPGYPYITDLQTFATNMTTATYWGASTVQYGVGALTVGGAIELTGQTPPSTISQAEIGAWVATELTSGAFGTPDPEGIYTLLYPSTTTITQPNPILATLGTLASCVAFGGYHDDVAVAFTDGGTATNFAYAVIPTCDTSVNDLTSVISHEWVEASTDPFVTASPTGAYSLFGGPDSAFFTVDADHAIWALLGGGGAGDLCEPEGNDAYVTPADVGYTVQRTWSNLLAKGSHDPCQPDPANTPFFAGAPVLTETETLDSSLLGGTIVTKGITIHPATSATIEVDLFSDADTNGPWTVSAQDVIYEYYGSYGLEQSLAFAWDRTEGVNGEKLHLTITVTRESILDGIHAFSITSTQGTHQSVWPGLVLE
jgi:hypothetical protein